MHLRSWIKAWFVFVGLVILPAVGWAQPHGAATSSKRPSLSTGVAFSPDGRLWVLGLNEKGQLFLQHQEFPGSPEFSAPRLLDTGDDEVSADGENRPKIAFGPNAWVVISYTQPLSLPYSGQIRMLRSDDGGQHFSPPFTVHDDRQIITHRFESIAFDGAGHLTTLWIDKRDQPAKGTGLPYVGAAIYKKVSIDGGRSFGPDQKLADHSCECCRIAITANKQGQLFAVWRHVFGTQTRDHAFMSLSTPRPPLTRATYDQWEIQACPHHGPGLAAAEPTSSLPEGFHMVWFGVRKQKGAVRYARLNAQGQPIEKTVRQLPDVHAEHADVLAHKNTVVVAWRSYSNGKTVLKSWTSTDGGLHFTLNVLGEFAGHNDHPRMAQLDDRMVVVWRTQEKIHVYEITP